MSSPVPGHPTPFRVATFNVENLDDALTSGTSGERVLTLEDRIPALRPPLRRLEADVLCLQEVHAQQQEEADAPRRLSALERLLEGTRYADYHVAHTRTPEGDPYSRRNLIVLSRFPFAETRQISGDLVEWPRYRPVTALPEEAPSDATELQTVAPNRPVFYAQIDLGRAPVDGGEPLFEEARLLHVINVHLKSRRPTTIEGQKKDRFAWRTASGWAEGYFLSSMKRVGQALEVRRLVDRIFDDDEGAFIAVCGDFNAGPEEVPVQAIMGPVENTENEALLPRELVPCARSVARSLRFTYIYRGQHELLDHVLMSRAMVPSYRGAEIHNERLRDESVAFAFEERYPAADHAPFAASFDLGGP